MIARATIEAEGSAPLAPIIVTPASCLYVAVSVSRQALRMLSNLALTPKYSERILQLDPNLESISLHKEASQDVQATRVAHNAC